MMSPLVSIWHTRSLSDMGKEGKCFKFLSRESISRELKEEQDKKGRNQFACPRTLIRIPIETEWEFGSGN